MKRLLKIVLMDVVLLTGGISALMAQTTLTLPQFGAGSDTTQEEATETKPLTALNAFVDAPAEVFPTLDKMTRMDMVDYFNSGQTTASKNFFRGDARIVKADAEQATVALAEVAEAEITLLPKEKGDTMLMVITTVKTPVEDSSVKFYDRNWKEAGSGLLTEPGLEEWMVQTPTASREDVENAVPFMLVKSSYDPATGVLTMENNIGEYLPVESKDLAKGSLRDKITYRWDGKKMKKN